MDLKELDATPPQRVIEAAVVALSASLGIDDPVAGAERLRVLAGGGMDSAKFDALLRSAAESATDDLVEMSRLVLSSGGDSMASDAEVRKAVDLAGRKQIVITPDMVYTAAVLVICAVSVLRPPKGSEETRMTIEEDANGKKKVVVNTSVKYFSPFSPLIKLIEQILGGGGGAQ